WAAVLGAAQRALPGAELRRIALPSLDDGRVVIRARAPGEWHPVGRSQVWIDPRGAQVLGAVDATSEGTGTRVSNAIYPLHAGSVGGLAGKLLVLLSGLLPPFFLVTGFLSWRARQRRRHP
ncbi:MAG: PepSY domain-containing protein, partial [Rhodanobacter sp.]